MGRRTFCIPFGDLEQDLCRSAEFFLLVKGRCFCFFSCHMPHRFSQFTCATDSTTTLSFTRSNKKYHYRYVTSKGTNAIGRTAPGVRGKGSRLRRPHP
uniref:Uncharacterized protein n=1 Tax=Trypanosoma congolense (strain IL3000) TaxID=1068625 RepID=G0UUA3_TRYCI|nr:hypothetical protein, unlikely [Trypanosoma congolense IL3000]